MHDYEQNVINNNDIYDASFYNDNNDNDYNQGQVEHGVDGLQLRQAQLDP